MIGTRIQFKRYGRIPANGQSKNWATGELEVGVSVYSDSDVIRAEFEERDIVIEGEALVVGLGSDGEPLIDARTIDSDDYNPVDELYIDGYDWDGDMSDLVAKYGEDYAY